jgi:hypothetical protein
MTCLIYLEEKKKDFLFFFFRFIFSRIEIILPFISSNSDESVRWGVRRVRKSPARFIASCWKKEQKKKNKWIRTKFILEFVPFDLFEFYRIFDMLKNFDHHHRRFYFGFWNIMFRFIENLLSRYMCIGHCYIKNRFIYP